MFNQQFCILTLLLEHVFRKKEIKLPKILIKKQCPIEKIYIIQNSVIIRVTIIDFRKVGQKGWTKYKGQSRTKIYLKRGQSRTEEFTKRVQS